MGEKFTFLLVEKISGLMSDGEEDKETQAKFNKILAGYKSALESKGVSISVERGRYTFKLPAGEGLIGKSARLDIGDVLYSLQRDLLKSIGWGVNCSPFGDVWEVWAIPDPDRFKKRLAEGELTPMSVSFI